MSHIHVLKWSRLPICIMLSLALIMPGVLVPSAVEAAPNAGVIYVNKAAPTGGDGATWTTAFKYLQDALAAATDGDEIWIAKGVYYPDEGAGQTPGDIQSTFTLVGPTTGLSLYGGFAGTETSRDQADPAKNLTVLSGDLDRNDVRDANGITTSYTGIVGNNAIGVAKCFDQGGRFTLDGLVLTGGSQSGVSIGGQGGGLAAFRCALDLQRTTVVGNQRIGETGDGGGMSVEYNDYVGLEPAIRVLGSTFRNNYATSSGGGLSADNIGENLYGVFVLIQDTVFEGNYAGTPVADECLGNWGGGGMVVSNTSLLVERSIFRQNSTRCRGGGAMLSNSGKKTVRDSVFIGNQVLDSGASSEFDVGYGGAIFIVRGQTVIDNTLVAGNSAYRDGGGISALAKSVFTNVTVVDNTAGRDGGGIWNLPSGPPGSAATLTLSNAIMYGNSAVRNGNGIYNGGWPDPGDFARISHSLVQDSGGSGTGWDPNVGVDLGGNIDAVPGFQNVIPDDPAASNYRLRLGSPAIDTGDTAVVVLPTDLDGKPRIFNSIVDMGAYETQVICPPSGTTRLHVNTTATGAATGVSWTDALPRLQDALNLAEKCPSNSISEVWAAQGTYYPDDGEYQIDGDRAASFQLQNDLAIYGGFLGIETDLSQRLPWAFPSVLSGDIDQDDKADAHDLVETPADIVGANSYHVLVGSGTNSTAQLDGFFVTAGLANGSPAAKQHEGGGFFAEGGSPTLNNVAFVGNIAEEGGAMTLVGGSNPAISNAWFGGNAASDYGGALHNESSNPTLVNVLMSGNRAAAGGGAIYNLASSPELTNVTIAGNAAGGTVSLASISPAAAEIAPAGGGILNLTGSKPDIRNSVIWGNEDSAGVGTPSASIRNLDIGSTPSVDHSDIQGLASISGLLFDGTSIDADPRFVTAVNPGNAPSFTPSMELKAGSPAIDVGNDAFNSLPTDLGQQPRIQDGDGNGTAAIDMGAFEAPLLLVLKLEVQKVANPTTADIGDAITYSYLVTNTGNVTVTLAADDDKLGSVALSPIVLAPGSSAAGSIVYTATAGDLPILGNTVHVTGTAPNGSEVHEAATAHVDLQVSTQMAVTKTASVASAEVGSTVVYTYELKNIGVSDLTNIQAVDDKLGTVAGLPASLAAGNSAQTSLSYVVHESDLPVLNNLVTVTASVGISTEVEHAVATVKVTSAPAIALHKTADRATAKVGDTVTYSYEVRNTGDVSLSNLVLVDSALGTIPLGASTLAPNATQTVTGTHVVQEGDLPGPLTNTAVVTGTGPTGAVRTSHDSASVSLSYRPRLAVEKTASPGNALPGAVVTYTYVVKNTGDVSLSSVSATDSALGPVTLSATTLAPGASATGTLNYTVQAGDLPGPLVNSVETQGTSPVGTVVKDQDSATVGVIDPNPIVPSIVYLPVIQK